MPLGEGVKDRRREPSRRLPKRSQARRRPVEQTRGGFIFYVWWSKIEENDSCPSPVPPSTELSLVAWSVTRVGEHKKSNFPPTSGYIFGQVRPSQALPRRRSWIPCISRPLPDSIEARTRNPVQKTLALRSGRSPESSVAAVPVTGVEKQLVLHPCTTCAYGLRRTSLAATSMIASVGQSSTPQMTTRTLSMIDTSAWFATRRHASRLTRSRLSQFFSQTDPKLVGFDPSFWEQFNRHFFHLSITKTGLKPWEATKLFFDYNFKKSLNCHGLNRDSHWTI